MRNQRELYKKTMLPEGADNEFMLRKAVEELRGTVAELSETVTSLSAAVDVLSRAVKCTVTFDSDGGSSVDSQTVTFNTTATEPEAPTKDGFTFGGWLLDGEAFSFTTKITSDITLTASWTE